ncbi:MAG: hypothetical protein EB147_07200 [Acidimicrobiia bacterium]|nr:hypothetical protein [Acidimicrobiia bacterium]
MIRVAPQHSWCRGHRSGSVERARRIPLERENSVHRRTPRLADRSRIDQRQGGGRRCRAGGGCRGGCRRGVGNRGGQGGGDVCRISRRRIARRTRRGDCDRRYECEQNRRSTRNVHDDSPPR